ncbi:MAG: hypothetical protein R3Y54_11355 [Eubacteriales bacterium]
MICGNNLCMYEKDNHCILKEISLNEIGLCSECIQINLNENDLSKIKEKMLRYYENLQ